MSDNRLQPLVVVIDGLPQVVSATYMRSHESYVVTIEGRGGGQLVSLYGSPVAVAALLEAMTEAVGGARAVAGEPVVIRKDLDWPLPPEP